jgi:hypothetical protein
VCTPITNDGTTAFANDDLVNSSAEEVTITNVSLVDSNGLTLLGASVTSDHFVGGAYPSPSTPLMVVAPRSTATLAIGVTLEASRSRGSASAVKVTFKTASGATGTTTTVNSISTVEAGKTCS